MTRVNSLTGSGLSSRGGVRPERLVAVGADEHVDPKRGSDAECGYPRNVEHVIRSDRALTMGAGEGIDERHGDPENTRTAGRTRGGDESSHLVRD